MGVGAGLQVCSQSGYTGLTCLVSRLLEFLRICLMSYACSFNICTDEYEYDCISITASLVSASGQCCSLYLITT